MKCLTQLPTRAKRNLKCHDHSKFASLVSFDKKKLEMGCQIGDEVWGARTGFVGIVIDPRKS